MNWIKKYLKSFLVGALILLVVFATVYLVSTSQNKNSKAQASTENKVQHDYLQKEEYIKLFSNKTNCSKPGFYDYGEGCKALLEGTRFGDCVAVEMEDPGGEFYNFAGSGRGGKCLMNLNLGPSSGKTPESILNEFNLNYSLTMNYTQQGVESKASVTCDFGNSRSEKIILYKEMYYLRTVCNYDASAGDIGFYRNSLQVSYPEIGSEKIAADLQIGACEGGGVYPKCACPSKGWFNSGTDEYYSLSLKKCVPNNHIALCSNLPMQSMYELFNKHITSGYYMVGDEVESGVSIPIAMCNSKNIQKEVFNMLEEWDTNFGTLLLSQINNHSNLNKVGKNFFGAWNQNVSPKGFTWKFMYTYAGAIAGVGAGCRGRVAVYYGKDDIVNWPTCDTLPSNHFFKFKNQFNYTKMDDRVLSGGNTSSVYWHELMHVIDGNSGSYRDEDWIKYENRANDWLAANPTPQDSFWYPSTVFNLTTGWDACNYGSIIREPFGRWWAQTTSMNGFIGCYGRTNHLEDRAQFLELLMSPRVRNTGFVRSIYLNENCCAAESFSSLEDFMARDADGAKKMKALIVYLRNELSVDLTALLTYATNNAPEVNDDTVELGIGVEKAIVSLKINDYFINKDPNSTGRQVVDGYNIEFKAPNNNFYVPIFKEGTTMTAIQKTVLPAQDTTKQFTQNFRIENVEGDSYKIAIYSIGTPQQDIEYTLQYRLVNPDSYLYTKDATVTILVKGEPYGTPKTITADILKNAKLEKECLRVDKELPQNCTFLLPNIYEGYKPGQEIRVKLLHPEVNYDVSSKDRIVPDGQDNLERLLTAPKTSQAIKASANFASVDKARTVPVQTKYAECKVIEFNKLSCSKFAFADVLAEWDSNEGCNSTFNFKPSCIVEQVNTSPVADIQPISMPSGKYNFQFSSLTTGETVQSTQVDFVYSSEKSVLNKAYDYPEHRSSMYCNNADGSVVGGANNQGNVLISQDTIYSCSWYSPNIQGGDDLTSVMKIHLLQLGEDNGKEFVSASVEPQNCEMSNVPGKRVLTCYNYTILQKKSYQITPISPPTNSALPLLISSTYPSSPNQTGFEKNKVLSNFSLATVDSKTNNTWFNCTLDSNDKFYRYNNYPTTYNSTLDFTINVVDNDYMYCDFLGDPFITRDQSILNSYIPQTARIVVKFEDTDPITPAYYGSNFNCERPLNANVDFINGEISTLFSKKISCGIWFNQTTMRLPKDQAGYQNGHLVVDMDGVLSTTADQYDFNYNNGSGTGRPKFKFVNKDFVNGVEILKETVLPASEVVNDNPVRYEGMYKPNASYSLFDRKPACNPSLDGAGAVVDDCLISLCDFETNGIGYFSCEGKSRPLVIIPGTEGSDNLARALSITVAALSVSERVKVFVPSQGEERGVKQELSSVELSKPETIIDCTQDGVVHTITGGGVGSNYGIGLLDQIEVDKKLTCDILATGAKVINLEGKTSYTSYSFPTQARLAFTNDGDQNPNFTSNCTQDLVISPEPSLENQAIPRLKCENISVKDYIGKQYLVIDLNGETADTVATSLVVNQENIDQYTVKGGINSIPAYSMAVDTIEKYVAPTILTPTKETNETISSAQSSVKKTSTNPFAREQSVYEAKYSAVPNTLVATGNQTSSNKTVTTLSSTQSNVQKPTTSTPTAQAGEQNSFTNFSSQNKNDSSNSSANISLVAVTNDSSSISEVITTNTVSNSTLIISAIIVGSSIVILGIAFGIYYWNSTRKQSKLLLDSQFNQPPQTLSTPTDHDINELLDHLSRLKK
jgi:hypothetical protein